MLCTPGVPKYYTVIFLVHIAIPIGLLDQVGATPPSSERLVLLHLGSSLKYLSMESRRGGGVGPSSPCFGGRDHARRLEVCHSNRLCRDDARRIGFRRGIPRRHGGRLLAPVHAFPPGGPRLGRIFLGVRAFRHPIVSCEVIGLDGPCLRLAVRIGG